MPNCDFYATPDDHEILLSWLFDEGTCHVYELHSVFERPLRRFSSAPEIIAEFDQRYSTGENVTSIHLQLYVLGAGPPFTARRVSLDPKSCAGATFRYAADGWGLVQLYLGAVGRNGLEDSHTNHNSQKRAEAWATSLTEQLEVGAWDFKRISSFSSRLNREIRKRAVGKLGSRAVLPGALKLWQAGMTLLPFKPGVTELKLTAEPNHSTEGTPTGVPHVNR